MEEIILGNIHLHQELQRYQSNVPLISAFLKMVIQINKNKLCWQDIIFTTCFAQQDVEINYLWPPYLNSPLRE